MGHSHPFPLRTLAGILAIPKDKRDQTQQDKLWNEFRKAATELSDLRNNWQTLAKL